MRGRRIRGDADTTGLVIGQAVLSRLHGLVADGQAAIRGIRPAALDRARWSCHFHRQGIIRFERQAVDHMVRGAGIEAGLDALVAGERDPALHVVRGRHKRLYLACSCS